MIRKLLALMLLLFVVVGCGATEPSSADDHDHETHAEDDAHAAEKDDEHADDHDEDEEGESREHGAHEHGAAALTIAWSGNDLVVDLDSPAYNVIGFEYAPSTDAEIQLLEDSVDALTQADFMQFTAAADCKVVSADIHTGFEETEGDGDEEETHSDIEGEYSVECANPDELKSVDLSGLFNQFPNFEDLQVQWVSDDSQSAETVTANSATVSFE